MHNSLLSISPHAETPFLPEALHSSKFAVTRDPATRVGMEHSFNQLSVEMSLSSPSLFLYLCQCVFSHHPSPSLIHTSFLKKLSCKSVLKASGKPPKIVLIKSHLLFAFCSGYHCCVRKYTKIPNNRFILLVILWVGDSGQAWPGSSQLDSPMPLQSGAGQGCSLLKAPLDWTSKMVHSHS